MAEPKEQKETLQGQEPASHPPGWPGMNGRSAEREAGAERSEGEGDVTEAQRELERKAGNATPRGDSH
jgi:hypothetical protein